VAPDNGRVNKIFINKISLDWILSTDSGNLGKIENMGYGERKQIKLNILRKFHKMAMNLPKKGENVLDSGKPKEKQT
jgi:hypothetical protein